MGSRLRLQGNITARKNTSHLKHAQSHQLSGRAGLSRPPPAHHHPAPTAACLASLSQIFVRLRVRVAKKLAPPGQLSKNTAQATQKPTSASPPAHEIFDDTSANHGQTDGSSPPHATMAEKPHSTHTIGCKLMEYRNTSRFITGLVFNYSIRLVMLVFTHCFFYFKFAPLSIAII